MSSEKKEKTTTIGVSGLLSTLLTVAFIILKLCNVIDWSWVWVLAPWWIPFLIRLIIFIILIVIGKRRNTF